MINLKNIILIGFFISITSLYAAQPGKKDGYECILIDGARVCFDTSSNHEFNNLTDVFIIEDESGNVKETISWNEKPNIQSVLAKLHDYVEKKYDQKIEIDHLECAKILSSLKVQQIHDMLALQSSMIKNRQAKNGCERSLAIHILIKQALEYIIQQLAKTEAKN